jgi:WhiB family transcriptional regulator, redox-sensing transcriptional regulator
MSVAAPQHEVAVHPTLTVVGSDVSDNSFRAPTIEEEMLASIERTAYLAEAERIPLTGLSILNEGNERVQNNLGRLARRFLIVGPDAIKFNGAPADMIDTAGAAALLGLLVVERRLLTLEQLQDRSHPQDGSPKIRKTVLTAAIDALDALMDSEGTDFLRKKGKGRNREFGLDDLLVMDLRHTRHTDPYKRELRDHSVAIWRNHVRSGIPQPVAIERPVVEGARLALSTLDFGRLKDEQRARYRELENKTPVFTDPATGQPLVPSAATQELIRREELRERIVEQLDPDWQGRAACKGPQSAVFFPSSLKERKDEREAREQRAKDICALCPIRRPCLEYALQIRDPNGVWGGLTEKERKQLLARPA